MVRHLCEQTTAVNERSSARRDVERLVEMAEHLAEHDRMLITQVYVHGMPIAAVARLLRVPPRRLQRRMARIQSRVCSRLYRFVAERQFLIPAEAQATARRVVLEGRSLRDVTRLTGLSLHRVRMNMVTVRECARIYA